MKRYYIICTVAIACSISVTKTAFDTCMLSTTAPDVIILNCSYTVLEDLQQPHVDVKTTVVDFSHGHLHGLPIFINPSVVPNVKSLNLSHNQLKDQLCNFADFTKLNSVDLSFNQINDMTKIECPLSLVKLSLTNNEIFGLRMQCARLRELYLQNNEISDIEISSLDSHDGTVFYELQVLNLTINHLQQVKEGHFRAFKKLEELYLAHNGINDIEEHSFDDMRYLEKIDLSNNDIQTLPRNIFKENEYLKYLDLSGNQLSTIPSRLPMLDWLDISFNRIQSVPENYSSVLYPVRVFLIGGNPFECTCQMLWLKELFDVRKYLMEYLKRIDSSKFVPVCDKPAKLKRKLWNDLPDSMFACSGFAAEDLTLTNEKIADVLNEKDVLKMTNVTENAISVKWNIISTAEVKSVKLSFYQFGKKKETFRTVRVASRINTGTYSIKSLELGTPYVVCLSFSVEKVMEHCIEVMTRDKPEIKLMDKLISGINIRLVQVAIIIGVVTVIYKYACMS